jgi:hypothetical protein
MVEADVVGEEVGEEVADELFPLVDADVVEFEAVPDPPVKVKYAL